MLWMRMDLLPLAAWRWPPNSECSCHRGRSNLRPEAKRMISCSRQAAMRSLRSGRQPLEFLDPRSHLDLPAPGAAVLLERRPVGLGDGVGVEQAVGRVGRHRPRSAPDAAIDHEM